MSHFSLASMISNERSDVKLMLVHCLSVASFKIFFFFSFKIINCKVIFMWISLVLSYWSLFSLLFKLGKFY